MAIPEPLVRTVAEGGVAVVPTDSCYGLVGDALKRSVVARVLALKGRPVSRPPAVFVPDVSFVEQVARVSRTVAASLEHVLPGPYTVLLQPASRSPQWLIGEGNRVGIRCTSFPVVRELLAATKHLLTATSANRTGLPQPYTPEELERVLPTNDVDYVLAERCGGLPPSTVIDMSQEPFVVLREGAVSKEKLLETLQWEES